MSFKRLLPVFLLLAGLAAFYAFRLDRWVNFDSLGENRDLLKRAVARNALLSGLGFVATYAISVAFSLPVALLLTITGGFLFGVIWGTMLNATGATLGAVCVFLAARYAFHDALHRRAGTWISRFEAGFQRNAFGYLLFLRLVPLFPFWLVNLVPAFLGIRLLPYVAATLIGELPATLVYTGIGNGLNAVLAEGGKPDLGIVFRPAVLLPLIGLGLLSLVPALFRAFQARDGWFRARTEL